MTTRITASVPRLLLRPLGPETGQPLQGPQVRRPTRGVDTSVRRTGGVLVGRPVRRRPAQGRMVRITANRWCPSRWRGTSVFIRRLRPPVPPPRPACRAGHRRGPGPRCRPRPASHSVQRSAVWDACLVVAGDPASARCRGVHGVEVGRGDAEDASVPAGPVGRIEGWRAWLAGAHDYGRGGVRGCPAPARRVGLSDLDTVHGFPRERVTGLPRAAPPACARSVGGDGRHRPCPPHRDGVSCPPSGHHRGPGPFAGAVCGPEPGAGRWAAKAITLHRPLNPRLPSLDRVPRRAGRRAGPGTARRWRIRRDCPAAWVDTDTTAEPGLLPALGDHNGRSSLRAIPQEPAVMPTSRPGQAAP